MEFQVTDMAVPELEPPGADVTSLKRSFLHHLCYTLAKDQSAATRRDRYRALAYTVRDRLIWPWLRTQRHVRLRRQAGLLPLARISAGPAPVRCAINLGIDGACRLALRELGLDMDELIDEEWDAGLGNGGLGRLAACFLDSMATLGLPAYGYGIRYEFGIFTSSIDDGYQVESPDNWLRYGNPWEIGRPEYLVPVRFYGSVMSTRRPGWASSCTNGSTPRRHGHGLRHARPRLRQRHGQHPPAVGGEVDPRFDLDYFNSGDYIRAVEDKDRTENITRVLYPGTTSPAARNCG